MRDIPKRGCDTMMISSTPSSCTHRGNYSFAVMLHGVCDIVCAISVLFLQAMFEFAVKCVMSKS
ncbi:hypothetical protein FIBSPDRAFT_1037921 [Athelia psychrophila]|uniref:Uncharacterized protein n=1 Tax=Athelia psychrophila TaxID=1759441 RepID=A0A166TX74_9AGAM|nr:hypothetical protein FIBSPDRAFT_1037921 [Fibularhizoctonia sp. CBS 109695]